MTRSPPDSIRPRFSPGILVAFALGAFAATSCSTGTSATGAWKEPRTVNAPYGNVLVVGVSPNSRVRRSFEEQLVAYVAQGGSKSSASILVGSAMGSEALSRDSVLAMVKSTGADAVLVTRLLRHTVKAGETRATADVKIGPAITVVEEPGLTEVFASDVTITQEEGELEAKSTALVETTLYDVADRGRVVYTVSTTSKFDELDGDEMVDVTGDMALAVSKQLRSERLIR